MSDEQGDRWGEITRHLLEWRGGDADASKRLFVIIYDELHAIARRQRRRVPGQAPSLSTTALVHEAYLKLMAHSAPTLLDRQHFFAGLSVEETAEALGVSPRTIKRGWHVARAYLFERLQGAPR